MKKSLRFVCRFAVFTIIFYLVCLILAFILRDDTNSYTRILMHELHTQQKIDTLFCGASHVSHGINPSVFDAKTGKNSFCTGTPSQHLEGTYAIIEETSKKHHLEKIFVELDFAVAKSAKKKTGKPTTDSFLVSHYLQDPQVKIHYLINSTSPKYYLNSILPIGKEKLITLSPKKIYKNMKSKLTGKYYKYIYKEKGSEYAGKGCILNDDAVENGSFFSGPEHPIPVQDLESDWEENLCDIISLCKQKRIDLTFYQNPSTDFYLSEKGNYDDYDNAIRKFLKPYGIPYYDFSLCKSEYLSLEDNDFSDDNHLNKKGVSKFTDFFCNFYNGMYNKSDLFYSSFEEKINNQPSTIYGLILDTSDDKKSVSVSPVFNHGDKSLITYDAAAQVKGKTIVLSQKTNDTTIVLPPNSTGTLIIKSYFNGIQQNCITKSFASL